MLLTKKIGLIIITKYFVGKKNSLLIMTVTDILVLRAFVLFSLVKCIYAGIYALAFFNFCLPIPLEKLVNAFIKLPKNIGLLNMQCLRMCTRKMKEILIYYFSIERL